MTNADLAKKIREAIFNQADEDGRVLHGDSMDRVIEKALSAHMPKTVSPGYGYSVLIGGDKPTLISWTEERAEPSEWR